MCSVPVSPVPCKDRELCALHTRTSETTNERQVQRSPETLPRPRCSSCLWPVVSSSACTCGPSTCSFCFSAWSTAHWSRDCCPFLLLLHSFSACPRPRESLFPRSAELEVWFLFLYFARNSLCSFQPSLCPQKHELWGSQVGSSTYDGLFQTPR